MDFFLFLFLNLLAYGDLASDPANLGWTSQERLRQLECERMSQAEAHARHPGAVPPPNARSTAIMEIDALACRHRVLPVGTRELRDEAILSRLGSEVEELAALAAASADEGTRWVVDAYYPSQAMVRKIANATRVALVERGRRVDDAPPRLSAGDVEVLRTLPMREAIPFACRRLHQEGGLAGDDDDVAFLAVALLHPSESQLHAGVCRQGAFRWLR